MGRHSALKRNEVLHLNRRAHKAKWGIDPLAMPAARRSGVSSSTVRGGATGGPLQLRVPGGAWHFVHEPNEPIREAQVWLEEDLQAHNGSTAIVVIGAGAGWIVDAAETLPEAVRVLVFEPEPVCCAAMFDRRDLRELIHTGRLMVLAGPHFEGAADAWRILGRITEAPPVLIHPVIAAARRELAKRAARLAGKSIADARANERARRRFAAPYLLNTLRNVPRLATESDVSALTGLYSGATVVVAAAGPSLNRNIEELRPHRDRTVLVAVDTALRPILSAGLTPDFVVAVDPSNSNARHLKSLPSCETTSLVADAGVQSAILDAFPGRAYLCRVAGHHPWPWLLPSGVNVGSLRAWGSVLITAFDLGVKIGGDPIVIIGADLAFTDGQPYCRGTVYEEDWAQRVSAGETLRDIWRHAIGLHPTVVERHDDHQVSTAPHLVQFRDGLLSVIRSTHTRVINATGAGILRGVGVETRSIDAALRNARPVVCRTPSRRPPPASTLELLQARTVRLVQRLDPPPEGWREVLAEHEPSDPTLPDQCESVRLALARWAGVPEDDPS